MIDTSIIERKIHRQVMDLCFEAIVTEAFISGLPIPEGDITDDMTSGFVKYAAECLKDLGSSDMMKQAMEGNLTIAQKSYLEKMYAICNEAATSVTSRIMEENKGNDKALLDAAQKVALTPAEYKKFSSAASSLTPDTLAKMIQKKTLDTIKDEQEAYKKDAELELELVNALNTVKEEEEDTDVPSAMLGGGDDAPTGAEIGQHDDDTSVEKAPESYTYTPANEGLISRLFKKKERKSFDQIYTEEQCKQAIDAHAAKNNLKPSKDGEAIEGLYKQYLPNPCPNSFKKTAKGFPYDMDTGIDGVVFFGIDEEGNTSAYALSAKDIEQYVSKPAQESHFVDVQNKSKDDPAQNITGMLIGMACPCPKHQKEESAKDPVKKAVDKKPGDQIGQQGATPEAAKGTPDMKKAMESLDRYLRSIAGENYRKQHSSVFSRIQELAYEGILATTENFTDIPFETMGAITRENTFERFQSHRTKDLTATMESVARYDFNRAMESTATPDGPEKESLNQALLVASIIYTFFETLNSMNLYCPKLAEIRNFVDETLPVKDKVMLDKQAFSTFIQKALNDAKSTVNTATSVPEVDAVQKDLDIVREKIAAPGFEGIREDISKVVESLQILVDQKRDALVSAQRPSIPTVESFSDTMVRTRDVLKFDRTASLMAKKPNVSYLRYKVDPQGHSKYVAVEAYTPNGSIANRSTIVLESVGTDLVDYVTSSIKSSKLMDCGKKILVSDQRSGKIYLDSTRL